MRLLLRLARHGAACLAATSLVAAPSGHEPAGMQAREAVRALALEPCDWQDIPGLVECGILRVPEDRAAPEGRALSIFVVVARATGKAAGEPLFFFTGGPGSAASNSAAALTTTLSGLRRARDFVFIDQRGTGRSAPLACPGPPGLRRHLRPLFDRAETAACRAALESRADLRLYTTADAVRDADDVRRALGYRRVNLHGSSYGARVAWEYAARYPRQARTLTLHGPVPPGFYTPEPFARALDTALDGLIADCERDVSCAARFPSLRADTARAFARLRRGPVRVRLADAGEPDIGASLTYGEFAEALRYQLYAPANAAGIPSLLTSAAKGDYAPIADAAVAMRARLARDVLQGMYLSVTCAEDIPFIAPAGATGRTATASAGTRLGDYRVRQQIDACREWPRGAAPGAHFGPPLTVPALIQVGEFDPATPVAAARRALELLPNGALIAVPHGGHGFGGLGIDACLASRIETFVTRGTSRGLDTSCVAASKRPPFILR